MILYGMVWCGMVYMGCGMVWYYMGYGISDALFPEQVNRFRYCAVWYFVVWYGMVWYGMVWYI